MPSPRTSRSACFALLLLVFAGCGNVLQDNGTPLADALEKGAARLRASRDS